MQDTQIVDQQEQEWINQGRDAVRRRGEANWDLGFAAGKWREATGGTDADYAKIIGSSQPTVNVARNIVRRFLLRRNNGLKHDRGFTWTRWRDEINVWDDADECLDWAEQNEATFDEMNAWRRMRRGEDLTETEQPQEDEFKPAQQAPPPDQPIVTPPQPAAPKSKQSKSKNNGDGPAVEEPREPTATTPEAPNTIDGLEATVRSVVQQERKKALRLLWRLLGELDPDKARSAKPTANALIAAIPATLDPLIIEAAKQWAKYRQAGPAKERMRDLTQWETVLKRMTQYQPDALLNAVEEAIGNGWTGWTHKLEESHKLASPRVRGTSPQEPIYRDFED